MERGTSLFIYQAISPTLSHTRKTGECDYSKSCASEQAIDADRPKIKAGTRLDMKCN